MPSGSLQNADPDTQRRLDRLRALARMQDSRFGLLGIRFGWDSVIGLIPGIGDTVTTALATYVVVEAARLGASKPVLARMAFNVAVDFVLGATPLIGDLADVAFKANLRNVALLERHLNGTS
jgi:hypothetical protein